MKHISKFDGCTYDISYSMATENGKEYSDDITIIWRNQPCGFDKAYDNDLPIIEFVNFYAGDYNYDDTEYYIKKYYEEKLKQKEQLAPKNLKTMDLPICYVHMIEDCLLTIKNHNLYGLIDSYDHDEEGIDCAKYHLEEILERFCKPLDDCDDLEIILED